MDTPGATPQELSSSGPVSGPARSGAPLVAAERAGTMVWPAGWTVTVVDETGSTNADLLAAAQAGAADRTVLAAAHQTAGRGRLDRTWTAPPGANLLVSLLLRDVPDAVHESIQRVALAAAAAARALTGADVRLKWPNDLLLDDRKLAGVLSQGGRSPAAVAARDGIDHVVVGIGVNVGWAPPDAARLADAPGGAGLDPLVLLRELLVAFDALPAVVHDQYRSSLATIGRRVRVDLPGDRTVEGEAIDVERDGRLVVRSATATHRFDVGDVVHLRPADPR